MNGKIAITENEVALVKKIAAWTYKTYWSDNMKAILTLNDLYHTGIIGLLEAKQKIDPGKNPEAYKATRIRGAILDFIRQQPVVRVPKKKWQQAKAVREARHELTQSGRKSGIDSVARHLGWQTEAVKKADTVKLSLVGSDEGSHKDNEMPMGVILKDNSPDPEEHILRKDLAIIVQKCLESIKESLDRMILVCRFQHSLKLKVLARVMGISIEGVRKKQQRAQEQMKDCLEAKGWSKECLTKM